MQRVCPPGRTSVVSSWRIPEMSHEFPPGEKKKKETTTTTYISDKMKYF